MVGEKHPKLTSSHEHTKITTVCRTTIFEKTINYQKGSSTAQDIKKEPQQDRIHFRSPSDSEEDSLQI